MGALVVYETWVLVAAPPPARRGGDAAAAPPSSRRTASLGQGDWRESFAHQYGTPHNIHHCCRLIIIISTTTMAISIAPIIAIMAISISITKFATCSVIAIIARHHHCRATRRGGHEHRVRGHQAREARLGRSAKPVGRRCGGSVSGLLLDGSVAAVFLGLNCGEATTHPGSTCWPG